MVEKKGKGDMRRNKGMARRWWQEGGGWVVGMVAQQVGTCRYMVGQGEVEGYGGRGGWVRAVREKNMDEAGGMVRTWKRLVHSMYMW